MALYSHKLSKSTYHNWIKAHLAILFTKEGIEPFVYKEIQEFQLKCLDDICYENGLISGTTCSLCDTQNVVACPTRSICKLQHGKCTFHWNTAASASCPNNICHHFRDKIKRFHLYQGPSYKNTDATRWCTDPWEVAKCFMPPEGYKDVTNPADTDLNGINSIIINYKGFQAKIKDRHIFEKTRVIARAVRHSPNLEIDAQDLEQYFTDLNKHLSDPGYLANDINAQKAQKRLLQLQNDWLPVGEVYIRKVLDETAEVIKENMKKELDENGRQHYEEHSTLNEESRKAIETLIRDGIKAKYTQIYEKLSLAVQAIEKLTSDSLEELHKEVTPQIPKRSDKQVKQTSEQIYSDDREKREKRLKDTFDSGQDMNGRLKVLTTQNIKDLLMSSTHRTELKGGFGDIYVSENDIPGLNMKIVIKKVELKKEEEQKLRSVTNEKLASRTMHFGIVPLLALREETNCLTHYFMTPYFENGALFDAVKCDNQRLADGSSPILTRAMRLRILYHIASAIDFLHTPVRGFRETILHMDIKTLNIVLDKYYNARLIDFGLAREMREGACNTTSMELAHTEGYYRTMKHPKLTEHADYYNFGVVTRELLTGLPPFDEKKKESQQLKSQTTTYVRLMLQTIWKNGKTACENAEDLMKLSQVCIDDVDLKIVNSNAILAKLREMMNSNIIERWRTSSHDEQIKPKCEMCLVYEAVQEQLLTHGCNCRCYLKVCVACMRNAYLNPIRCHSCDTYLKPIIGHDWGAVLIAGNDPDEEYATAFKDDVAAIKTVVTSKWPLVIGISESMVKTVCPEKPGTDECLKGCLKNTIAHLNDNKDIKTMLIYYSGHYYPEAVENRNGQGFKLGGEYDYLTLVEFQSMLLPFLKDSSECKGSVASRRLIVFLDCCKAPSLCPTPPEEIEPPAVKMEQQASASLASDQSGDAALKSERTNSSKRLPFLNFCRSSKYSIQQISACRQNEKTDFDLRGSVFRTFLVQALTRKALKNSCRINEDRSTNKLGSHVQECKDEDCRIEKNDFFTMEDLRKYIASHLNKYPDYQQPVIDASNVGEDDAKIGYAINFSADLEFTYKFKDISKPGKVPQQMFSHITNLKAVLYDRFFDEIEKELKDLFRPPADFVDILCIKVERGPKRKHLEELDTLEQITGAWNSKRELIVSLREFSEIRKGKVGVFLNEGCLFSSVLERSLYAQKSNDSSGIYFSIKSENFVTFIGTLEDLRELQLEMVEGIPTITQEKDQVKELQVIFPVKSDGTTLPGKDFVCFEIEMKKEK